MATSIESERSPTCGHCGYDEALYSLRHDAVSSLIIVPTVQRAAAEGLSGAQLTDRPNGETWSIAEYANHTLGVYQAHRAALERAKNDPGAAISWPTMRPIATEPESVDFGAVMDAMAEEAIALRALAAAASDEDWHRGFDRHIQNVVHEGFHHLADIGDIRAGLGAGPVPARGRVTQLSSSAGGVPKQPIDEAAITPSGVGGDSQNDRKHHGRPCQAVCLYSEDVLAALRAEGHVIEAGFAGENITVGGIDWNSLRPGSRLTVGPISMLVSAHAIPCAKNAAWFADGYFNRMLHSRHPGWSRLYAIPLDSGTVRPGDPVTVG